MGVYRNEISWVEVVAYHAFTNRLAMYLIELNICGKYCQTKYSYILRTKYVLNFFMSINIYIIDDLCAFSNQISCSYHNSSFVSVRCIDSMSVTVILDIVNDTISVIISRAENENSTFTTSRRITVDTKLALSIILIGTISPRTRLSLI